MSTYKKLNTRGIHTALTALTMMASQPVWAEALNTQLPKQQEETFSVPVNVDIPAQPLANSLHDLGKATGMNISFPNDVVSGKTAPEVRGRMTRKEALQRLLGESGLVPKVEGNNIFIQKPPKDAKKDIQLDKVEVRAKRFYEVGPLPGLGLTKEEIPGNVQSISAKEIKEAHSLSLTDLMNRKLQSVTVNDYQGNPFQMDVQYRGFTAGPQIGTPQGLSVFFDGIRVNEPFGDVVNWDMIPMNAIANVDVFPGSNPIFGLNTLGGAFTLKTKDGFNNAGVDADVLTGSFGRKQLQAEAGWNNGTIGLFAAGNIFLEDGWRKNSPSKVNQLFTKASFRGDKLDLNFSTLLVANDLTGNGLIPSEMYDKDRRDIFTAPDETKNKLQQFQLSGSYFVNDTFTITGQVYRRKSDRKQTGADVFTDYDEGAVARRRPNPGDPANGIAAEQYTCLFSGTNPYGIPDYYLIPINETQGENFYTPGSVAGDFYNEYNSNNFVISSNFDTYKNVTLDEDYAAALKSVFNFWRNPTESIKYNRSPDIPVAEGPLITDVFGNQVPSFQAGGSTFPNGNAYNVNGPDDNVLSPDSVSDLYYYKTVGGDLIRYHLVLTAPTNAVACNAVRASDPPMTVPAGNAYALADADGNPVYIDGADGGINPVTGKGFSGAVEGVPTAIINNNQINQIVDGASIQFNWNFEKHKFMVGASIDSASADYRNTSQLGFLDASRNAYLDPQQAHPQFIGAYQAIENNNFEGTNSTKSVYFSETWKPLEAWSFSASGRYNQTRTKNKIAARYGVGAYGIGDLIGVPDQYNVCNGDCSTNPPPTNFRESRLLNQLDPAETEKFSYYSFNPSLGATWQAQENLNVFANWAKGTRTPSVVELGCAFDDTPTVSITGAVGPRSIIENRTCTLPTTLSGDPYLPQIRATTYDIGMRGTFKNVLGTDDLRWNLGAFQTDLKDDIYFVAVGNGAGFFQSIGKTRRRGIEAGLNGRKDKWGFSVNYSLTDATFEDDFLMISNDNSSSYFLNGYGYVINVKEGSRIPGVSLHNLNANISYEVTPKWQVGLSAVLHSESFVRGNENNEHKVGVETVGRGNLGANLNALRRPTSNPGTVPGYATFNFQTSYKISKEWTATMLVNNIFDREYFTAGRLGRNPFSPSISGAIGPDGYNHNSDDWRSTNFIAPSAPRAVWFSLNYQFQPD